MSQIPPKPLVLQRFYDIHHGNVWGYDVTQAIFHFSFSEELYYLTSLPCQFLSEKCYQQIKEKHSKYNNTSDQSFITILNQTINQNSISQDQYQENLENKIRYDQVCESCDYSDPNECPKFPPNSNCSICPEDSATWCDGEWKVLSPNETIYNLNITDHDTVWRFYVSPENACLPFQVLLIPHFGDADIYLGLIPPSSLSWEEDWYRWLSVGVDGNPETIYGCPYVSNSSSEQDDCECLTPSATYFLYILKWTTVSFDLKLTFYQIELLVNQSSSSPIPENRTEETCFSATSKPREYCDINSEYPCIYPGRSLCSTLSPYQQKNFSLYIPPGCPTMVSVYLDSQFQYMGFYLTYDGTIYQTVSGGIQMLSLSFCDLTSFEFMKFVVTITNFLDGPQEFNLTVVTNAAQFSLTKLGDLNPFSGAYTLSASSRLVCDTTPEGEWSFTSSGSTAYSQSPYHTVPPRVDYNSFWPPPYPLTSYALELSQIQLPRPPSIPANSTFLSSVILDVTFPDLFSKKFLDQTVLENNCHIEFKNQIVSCSYMPINGISEPLKNLTPPVCVPSDFQDLSDKIEYALDRMSDSQVAEELEDWRYQLDTYVFNDVWYGCEYLLDTLLVENVTTVTISDLSCYSQDNQSDPCCNSTLAWSIPCLKREVSRSYSQYEINEANSSKICSDTSCLDTFLNDYIYEKNKDDGQNVTGCSAILQNIEVFNTLSIESYQKCLSKVFPNFPYPITCYADDECPTTQKCDLLTHQCLATMKELTNQFLQCFEDLSPPFIQYNILEKGSPYFPMETHDCVDLAYGLPVQNSQSLHSYWVHDNFEGCVDGCPELECIDPHCTLPLSCQGSPVCAKYWKQERVPEQYCDQNSNQCNWDVSIIDQTKCLNNSLYFCGLTENGINYVEIPHISENLCENRQVCVTPFGTIDTNASQEECENIGKCSNFCYKPKCVSDIFPNGVCYSLQDESNCPGHWNSDVGLCIFSYSSFFCQLFGLNYEDCSSLRLSQCYQCEYGNCSYTYSQCYVDRFDTCESEEECKDAVSCTDNDYLYHPECDGASKYGGCLKNLSPWLKEECGTDYITHEAGCIWNASCINYVDCMKKENHFWLPKATNKAECINLGTGCRQFIVDSTDPSITGTWVTPKNAEDCMESFTPGIPSPYFLFTPARWYKGVMRQLSWARRDWVVTREWQTTFDFGTFGSAVEGAINEQYSFQLQSEANCRFSKLLSTMEVVVCASSKKCNDDCWDDWDQMYSVGMARVCARTHAQIVAPPATMIMTPKSVSSDDGCIDLKVSDISKEECKMVEKNQISIQWGHLAERKNYVVVKNSHGAYIGQVIGDGVSLKTDDDKKFLMVGLCLDWFRTYVDLYPGEFPILDFAKSNSDLDGLRPMETEIYENNGQICANITDPETNPTIYFPIVRKSDWTSETDILFSNGEIISILILATLYMLIVLYGVFLILYARFSPRETRPLKVASLFIIFLLLFNLGRCVFYSQLSYEIFQSRNLYDYLFSELPTFIYMTAYSVIFIYWWSVLRTPHPLQQKKFFWMRMFTFNGILYTLFALFLILFEVLPYPDERKCGGRIVETSGRAADNFIIVTYRSFIAVVSLYLAVGFLVYGTRMYRALTSVGAIEDQVRNIKLILTSITCVVSFIFDSIFYDVLALINTELSAYWALLLIPIEIIPSAVMLTIISPFADSIIRNAHQNAMRVISRSQESSYSNTINTSYGGSAEYKPLSTRSLEAQI